MNLLHMTYFIAVVEHESISGAAQSLFITQQTLSSHVAAMEKELGTSLFDRRPKFRLTQAGEIFYRYCIRFRDLNDAMVSEFRDLSGEVSDILHVGISQTRSRILMPSILLRMHRELPRVQVRLTEQTNEVLIKKLLKGELDLMIGDIPDHPDIQKEVMYRESMVLTISEKLISEKLISEKQLAELTRTKDLRLLAGIPFVMNTRNDIAGRYGASIMESFSMIPRIASVSDSAETCLQMCLDGLGAYICPDLYVRFYHDKFAELRVIPLDYSYGIFLAQRKGFYEKRSVREFRKYCLETGRNSQTGNPVTG